LLKRRQDIHCANIFRHFKSASHFGSFHDSDKRFDFSSFLDERPYRENEKGFYDFLEMIKKSYNAYKFTKNNQL